MKTRTTNNLILCSSLALAVMFTIHAPVSAQTADPADGKEMKMEGRMMEQCEEMKKEKHMMQHMQMSKESMSKCPMMKEMNETSDDAHAEHLDISE